MLPGPQAANMSQTFTLLLLVSSFQYISGGVLHHSLVSTSCADRCGEQGHDDNAPCQCNNYCIEYGDCCSDYQEVCLSCVSRCDIGYDYNLPCQCNTECPQHGNCCDDFDQVCGDGGASNGTCVDRCGAGTDPDQPCQCNTVCQEYGDCCPDYEEECGTSGGRPTDDEIMAATQTMWEQDSNRLREDIDYELNPQGPTYFARMNESFFEKTTYKTFISLLDNYHVDVGTEEPDCPVCEEEINAFLDAVMAMPVMVTAKDFLADKGLVGPSDADFRDLLIQYWFTPYSRSGGIVGSSGFEHTFVGEIKSGSVSGFHGWIQFYMEEKEQELVFSHEVGICEPRTNELSMDWLGYEKPITSIMHGTSPEFQLALYTLCFASRYDTPSCPILLDNQQSSVTVWSIRSPEGILTIGTAYPTC